MDIVIVSQQTVISTYPQDEDSSEEPCLFVLDRGYVSAYATVEHRHAQRTDPVGPSSEVSASNAPEVSGSRLRLAKYGPGTVLGIASFMMPREMPDLAIMPMVFISDTFCQVSDRPQLFFLIPNVPVPLMLSSHLSRQTRLCQHKHSHRAQRVAL